MVLQNKHKKQAYIAKGGYDFAYTPYRIKQGKGYSDTIYSAGFKVGHKNTRLGVHKDINVVKNAQKSL